MEDVGRKVMECHHLRGAGALRAEPLTKLLSIISTAEENELKLISATDVHAPERALQFRAKGCSSKQAGLSVVTQQGNGRTQITSHITPLDQTGLSHGSGPSECSPSSHGEARRAPASLSGATPGTITCIQT